jgi:membrane-associated phospholipid phosphatase
VSTTTAASRPQAPWRDKFIVEVRRRSGSQRRTLYVLAATLVTVGAAGFAVLLVGVATHSGVELVDRPVERWFVALRQADTTPVMIVLAVVFGPVGMPIIVAVVLVVWIALTRHLWRPILLFCGMCSGVLLAQAIAPIVRHPRPPLDLMLFGADRTYSFPSGHVLGMSDFFLLTAFLLASRISRPPVTVLLVSVAVVGVGAQVFSRLYLGYHWFSDVAGSVALSLVIVGIVIAIDTRRTVRVGGEPLPGALSAPQREGT